MTGRTIEVDVAFGVGKWHVALKKNDAGKYDMTADWYGVRWAMTPEQRTKTGVGSDVTLQDALLRLTTKHTIISRYRKQGFNATVKEDAEHNLDVTLTRY